jgi:large subunit ribosomal protein L3|tara:strand:- start:261 stop:893 length:633 start_codon:yes stop_codon:yes gene_type:complete
MSGLIGKKIGMTSIFDDNGRIRPCTVIEAGPCTITQIKDQKKDGYNAIQLSYDELSKKKVNKPISGHFKKSRSQPKKKIVEFKNFRSKELKLFKLGMELKLSDIFRENDFLDVKSISKGKGFQGVVKRHNFSGVGESTHGQHNRLRAPGSIGAGSTPSRVFKGMRMAGRMGGENIKQQNLKVLKINKDNNLVYVSGSVPGYRNSYVTLEK